MREKTLEYYLKTIFTPTTGLSKLGFVIVIISAVIFLSSLIWAESMDEESDCGTSWWLPWFLVGACATILAAVLLPGELCNLSRNNALHGGNMVWNREGILKAVTPNFNFSIYGFVALIVTSIGIALGGYFMSTFECDTVKNANKNWTAPFITGLCTISFLGLLFPYKTCVLAQKPISEI